MRTYNITVGLYLILSLVLFTMMFYPIDNMQVRNDRIFIANKGPIRPGDRIQYELTYYKPYNISGVLLKGIQVNSYTIVAPPVIGNLQEGHHKIIAGFNLPKTDFIIGRAKLVIQIKYVFFGGLRMVDDYLESEEFMIVK